MLLERIEALDWKNARADVAPFLERAEDVDMLTRENLMRTIKV